MSTVANCLRNKQARGCGGCDADSVATIGPDASVLDAAKAMNDRRIGSLVVSANGSDVAGIITERDILTRIVATGRDPAATKVRDAMTARVVTCTPEHDADSLRRTMQARRIRHIPVLENGRLCGMVSLGDLNAIQVEAMSHTIVVLEEYIQRG